MFSIIKFSDLEQAKDIYTLFCVTLYHRMVSGGGLISIEVR